MKAIIQAGGRGTRLHPVTLEIPKPLLPVRKQPIIGHLVKLFKKYGIADFVVAANKDHLEHYRHWKKDFFPEEKISFVSVDETLGTFGVLKKIKDERLLDDGSFFVSNGDELKDLDLSAMADFHKKAGLSATTAVTEVEQPRHYGVVVCSGDKIIEFLEKPENPPSRLINTGLYLMEPEVFDFYPHSGLKFSMVERDLLPRLAKEGKLAGFKFKGQWFDCGTFERWEKAMKEWKGI